MQNNLMLDDSYHEIVAKEGDMSIGGGEMKQADPKETLTTENTIPENALSIETSKYFIERRGKYLFRGKETSFLFHPYTISLINSYHNTINDKIRRAIYLRLVEIICEESSNGKKRLIEKIKEALYYNKSLKYNIGEDIDERCTYIYFPDPRIMGYWTSKNKSEYPASILSKIEHKKSHREKALTSLGLTSEWFGLLSNSNKGPSLLRKKGKTFLDGALNRTIIPGALKRKHSIIKGVDVPYHARMKFIRIHSENRPPYYGTKIKKAGLSGRDPFKKSKELDYEIDSDEEWIEESVDGDELVSELDESDIADDDDEYDAFLVPDGYLSENEGVEHSDIIEPKNGRSKNRYRHITYNIDGVESECNIRALTNASLDPFPTITPKSKEVMSEKTEPIIICTD